MPDVNPIQSDDMPQSKKRVASSACLLLLSVAVAVAVWMLLLQHKSVRIQRVVNSSKGYAVALLEMSLQQDSEVPAERLSLLARVGQIASKDVELDIYRELPGAPATLLYSSRDRTHHPQFSSTATMRVGQQTWTLIAYSSRGAEDATKSESGRYARLVFGGSLLVSFTLSFLFWQLNRQQGKAEAAALRALKLAHEAEKKFQSIVQGITDYSIATLDTSGRFHTWNLGAERLFGYRAEETIGRTPSLICLPGAENTVMDFLVECTQHGCNVLEDMRVRKDGSRFLAHITVNPVRNVHGDLVGFAAITRDITSERKAQQELVRSEKRLRDAQDLARVGHWDLDCATNRGRASERAAFLMGITSSDGTYSLEECVANIAPEDRERIANEFTAALGSTDEQCDLVHRCKRPDGGIGWVSGRARIYRDAQGKPTHVQGIIIDISEFKEAELARLEQARVEKRINRIVETVREVIFEIDYAGRWVFLNSAWANLSGFAVEDTLNHPVVDWIHPSFHELYGHLFRNLHDGSLDVLRDEVLVLTADGYRWMEVIAEVADHGSPGERRLTGTLVDIHERKEASAALEQAREAAEEANRAKSEFLAVISRELRAPLGALVGMSKVLCNAKLTSQERETALTVRQSTQELLTLLNSLLDLSRFEAGLMAFNPVAVDVRLATEDVIESFCNEADRKRLDLALRYTPEIPKRVVTDPGRYRQLLSIFIENAIRYSHAGQIIVSISAETLDERRVALHIQVQDSGSGLFPEGGLSVEHSGLKLTKKDSTKKLGLGLELARHLISFLDGTATVESSPGKGTAISLRLLCARDAEEWQAPNPPESIHHSKLLIVEPSLAMQAGLQSMLHGANAEIAQVYDAHSALELISSQARFASGFQAVLYSTESVGMDWDEFAKRLRENPQCASTALVLLSRSTNMPSRFEAARIGFTTALRRNPSRQQLWTALTSALDLSQTRQPVLSSGDRLAVGRSMLEAPRPETKKRVLLISSPDADVSSITAAIRESGCEWSVKRDESEASVLNVRTPFDLVLLDSAIIASGLSQFTRDLGTGPRSPLAVISPNTGSALPPGADEVLPKDFTAKDLLNLLARLDRSNDEAIAFDFASVSARCGNDRELLCELAEEFRENVAALVPMLIKAVAVRDSAIASDCIEKLKAAATFFGAAPFCEHMDQLAELVNLNDWGSLPRRLSSARMELNRLCNELPYSPAVDLARTGEALGDPVQC